ncbi:hypothetical protein NMG60_11023209 [Bertholletia excelsa]
MEAHRGYISEFADSVATEVIISNHKVGAALIAAFLAGLLLYRQFHRSGRYAPVFTFKPAGSGAVELYCAVCLHEVAGGERCRRLSRCGHSFHLECIDAWFEFRATCPLCRGQVHLPKRQKGERSVLSHFLAFSRHFLRKLGSFVVDEITKAFLADNH